MQGYAYLKDGQQCYITEKIGDRYIVNKIYTQEDADGNTFEVMGDDDIVVDAVYESPPLEKYHENIEMIQELWEDYIEKIRTLKEEKDGLEKEIEELKKQERWILENIKI
jgi:hypothetical protein